MNDYNNCSSHISTNLDTFYTWWTLTPLFKTALQMRNDFFSASDVLSEWIWGKRGIQLSKPRCLLRNPVCLKHLTLLLYPVWTLTLCSCTENIVTPQCKQTEDRSSCAFIFKWRTAVMVGLHSYFTQFESDNWRWC